MTPELRKYAMISLKTILPKEDMLWGSWLGKFNWLQWEMLGGSEVRFTPKIPKWDGTIPQADYIRMARTLKSLSANSQLHQQLIELIAATKVFGQGPKVFRPTFEQCMAMSEVTVDIPILDYHQPYEAIVYEYPQEFCVAMMEKLHCKSFPKVSVCYQDADGFIVCTSYYDDSSTVYALIPPRPGITVEELLVTPGFVPDVEEPEFKLGELLQRLSLNFSLLMTQYRVTIKPEDPQSVAHHRQMMKANNPARKEKGRLLSLTDASIISFDQDIQFYEERDERTTPHEGEGNKHVRPHWRKGHWRMQAHGPQHSERKRLFIKPLMVKKSMFVGNFADTSVIYEGKK